MVVLKVVGSEEAPVSRKTYHKYRVERQVWGKHICQACLVTKWHTKGEWVERVHKWKHKGVKRENRWKEFLCHECKAREDKRKP